MATTAGLESSHLWLCDKKGGLYMVRDIQLHSEAVKVGSEASQTPPKWVKVGSGFSVIVGGYSGLVCGVQSHNLSIRLGVTHDNPAGLSWSKVFCNVVNIFAGTRFLVRQTNTGLLFFTDMSEVPLSANTKALLTLDWHSISPCPSDILQGDEKEEDLSQQYFALDNTDRLFLIGAKGHVCMYTSLGEEDAAWSKVSLSPSFGRSDNSVLSFDWLPFWREKKDDKCVVKSVSAGNRSLLCLDFEPGLAWQLVLSNVKSKSGKTELKAEWTKCKLPFEEYICLFCADKCQSDHFYCVTVEKEHEETALFSCSLNSSTTGSGFLEISAPLNRSLCSMSVCRTVSQSSQTAGTSGPINIAPSLYPSLQHSEEFDVCCEYGDCSFCRQAAEKPLTFHTSLSEPFEAGHERKSRKRHSHTELETLSDSDNSQEESLGRTYTPKRVRLSLNRSCLLEGVHFVYKKEAITDKVISMAIVNYFKIEYLSWVSSITRDIKWTNCHHK